MRYQRIKLAVLTVCVLAACVCYSCRGTGLKTEDSELLETAAESTSGRDLEDRIPEGAGSAGGKGVLGESGPDENSRGAFEGVEGGPPESAGAEPPEVQEGQEAIPNCFVHICGEVRSPGVYELPSGSRIFQAVEAAGGFTDFAALEYLNMAELVSDGMKIVVPDTRQLTEEQLRGPLKEGNAAFGVVESGGQGGSGAGAEQKVNLNTATKEELMTLKGIGEAKADDIIAYRESHGGFARIEDIMKISGIKNAAFEKIKDDITV